MSTDVIQFCKMLKLEINFYLFIQSCPSSKMLYLTVILVDTVSKAEGNKDYRAIYQWVA